MKKILMLFLAVAMVGLAAGCGGGDDDDDLYNFGGRWAGTFVVTASNVPGIPVGDSGPDILVITQSGNNITVTYQSLAGELLMAGTCDPDAKTFSAQGVDTDGISHRVGGTGIDDNSMSGTFSMQLGAALASGTWTADLASRAAGGDGGGIMRTLAGALAK